MKVVGRGPSNSNNGKDSDKVGSGLRVSSTSSASSFDDLREKASCASWANLILGHLDANN